MSDENTAIAERSEQDSLSLPDKIRRGAGLVPDDWPNERVLAVAKMLPKDFRTTTNAIALFERAIPAGLNPLNDEIWAWEQSGDLQFMVSRDGWIKIADRDPKVKGLEFGHVYEEDTFEFVEEGSHINVTHKGTMKRGDLVGAFCVVHHEDGDHIERRLIEDYDHLSGKKVWRENEQEMLLTRVISTCVRLKCPEAAGLQAEGGMALDERPKRDRASQKAEEATGDELDELAAELEAAESEDGGREIEAEAKPADEGKEASGSEDDAPSSGTPSEDESSSTPSTPTSSKPEPSSEEGSSDSSDEEDEKEPEMVVCPVCTEEMEKGSLPGHLGGHSRSGLKLPDEVERVVEEGDGYAFVLTESGEIIESSDGPFPTWEDAVKAAQSLAEASADESSDEEQADAFDEPADAAEEAPEEDEAPEAPAEQPEESWDDLYRDIMLLSGEHPDGLKWIRNEATDLFSGRDVETTDEGIVKTNNLDVMQLAELKNHLQEVVENADF